MSLVVVVVRSLLHSKLKCLKHLQTSFSLNPCYLDQISSCLFVSSHWLCLHSLLHVKFALHPVWTHLETLFLFPLPVCLFWEFPYPFLLHLVSSCPQVCILQTSPEPLTHIQSDSLFQISYNCILKPALLPMSCLFADVWICLLGLTVRLSCSHFILPAEPCCWILIPVSSYLSSTGSNMNSRPTALSFSIHEVTAFTYALEQLCTVVKIAPVKSRAWLLCLQNPGLWSWCMDFQRCCLYQLNHVAMSVSTLLFSLWF